MIKIKDESGKVLYNVSDEATEPTPTVLTPVPAKEPETEPEEEKE